MAVPYLQLCLLLPQHVAENLRGVLLDLGVLQRREGEHEREGLSSAHFTPPGHAGGEAGREGGSNGEGARPAGVWGR